MGDEIEFATADYQGNAGMDSTATTGGKTTVADTGFMNYAPCPNGSCTNKATEAEEAWVKLVSAIPVTGQAAYLTCVAHGTAAPTQEELQSLVAEIRPGDPDKFALREISDKWVLFQNDLTLNPDTAVEPILSSKLTELSNGWQGDDFDAFAEQMEKVFTNCEQIKADIGDKRSGMAGLLEQKAAEIYALQGGASGELPYPAPQYWVEDEGGLFSDPTVHMRTPFHSGECEIGSGCAWDGEDDSAKRAMEIGGFDGEYANEISQYVTDQTEFHLSELKAENPDADEAALRQQAQTLAQQDADVKAGEDYNEANADYQDRATAQNETVIGRWSDAEVSASEFVPTVEPSQDTTFRDSAGDLDSSGYSPPGGADFSSSPTGSGASGLDNPAVTGSFGSGGTTGTGTGTNPWESGSGTDDDATGGLASGGGLGSGAMTAPGAGAGLGAGGGAGSGLGGGAGLFGPAASGAPGGGAGAGRGAGSGAGKGSGLFGKSAGAGARGGASGMMGSGGGRGGRGGAGGTEDEEGKETWLTEDEDVWGLARFNDEDDPFA